ncbi:SOS response-associated peptidase [Novosphingobium mangrovi (ex Huang et al. 2023)]|uniref:Abasic site processing protein n=1 Tax=Novosphingobium mangrovi (ex Huang et al. 2023) TaxID=2976432 RepID=A0ABT2I170_9SPHN|nr:SOS response-associated peptidase [Novosphingobium mangrovi (ex Huang et al. 2023)]MCT2398546.1 SOS response-associated peptidase [Novosphingobium mangrovi (ex Huang et al. 2023)]
MCNLYRMARAQEEVARLFGARQAGPSNVGELVYPGYSGMVVAGGELRSMAWGFPLTLKGSSRPRPVNNARADKLNSGFWRSSFRERRCLIPMEAFAEAEGPKGRKTRTWLSLPDRSVFTCAGIWRDSAEWGPAYSMVMTDAAKATAEVHDRVPVILSSGDEDRWLNGSPDDALALCRPWTEPITIKRTDERWVHR